jgi:hypothetical protein
MTNADVERDSRFPAGYRVGHTAGPRLLRVGARIRAEHGREAVGPVHDAIGTQAFDSDDAPALGPDESSSRIWRLLPDPMDRAIRDGEGKRADWATRLPHQRRPELMAGPAAPRSD